LRQRIIDECLVAYLHDSEDAWEQQPGGNYVRVNIAREQASHSAQEALMARYARASAKRGGARGE
jgi:polyphosphate kinase